MMTLVADWKQHSVRTNGKLSVGIEVDCSPCTGALRGGGGGFPWPLGTPLDPVHRTTARQCVDPLGFWCLEGECVVEPEVKVLLSLCTINTINHPAYARISGIQHCLVLLPPSPLSPSLPLPLSLSLSKHIRRRKLLLTSALSVPLSLSCPLLRFS